MPYQEQLKGFFMEAEIMKQYRQENVLSLLGLTLVGEVPAILLPFMNHGDLLSYVRNENNHPSMGDLIQFGIQVAQGQLHLLMSNF